MSKASKRGVQNLNGNKMKPLRSTFGKSGWRTIGGVEKFYRSIYEANYARYLQLMKDQKHIVDWEHEPKTFWFEGIRRGCVSYKPDFKVVPHVGKPYWVEVKGFMDAKSKTKIKRFAKYFPEETLFVIDKKWFKKNSNIMYAIIKDWEKGETKCKKISEKLKLV